MKMLAVQAAGRSSVAGRIIGLLAENPFPESPPRYIKAELYLYTFTGYGARGETGNWWERRYVRTYFGPVTLGRE